MRQEGTGHDGGGSDAHTPPNDIPIQQPRAPIFCGSNQGARYGCRKRRCDRDKPREAQQTEQRSGYRAASLSEEAAEKPYDCACQKSSQMLPGQSVFSLVVLSKDFHAGMGLEKKFAPVVQFLPLCTGFSLRRDSTEQELVRQVGTPGLGSSHWVNTMYAAIKTIIHAHCGISVCSFPRTL